VLEYENQKALEKLSGGSSSGSGSGSGSVEAAASQAAEEEKADDGASIHSKAPLLK
jgi:hypothetical protein